MKKLWSTVSMLFLSLCVPGMAWAEVPAYLHLAAQCETNQDFGSLYPAKGGWVQGVKLYQKYFNVAESGVMTDWIYGVEIAGTGFFDHWDTALTPGSNKSEVFNQISFKSASDPAAVASLLIESKTVQGDFEALLVLANPSAKRIPQGTIGNVMKVVNLKCTPVSQK